MLTFNPCKYFAIAPWMLYMYKYRILRVTEFFRTDNWHAMVSFIISKTKLISNESRKNTSYYNNFLNFLGIYGTTRRGRGEQVTILNTGFLQPGSNNKCNFMYNSLYHCCGFVQCGVCVLQLRNGVLTRLYLQSARPNRPMILIIIPLGSSTAQCNFSRDCWRASRAHICFIFTVKSLHAWNNTRLSRDHSSCQTWSPQTVTVLARSTDAKYVPCGCQDTAVTPALCTFKCQK